MQDLASIWVLGACFLPVGQKMRHEVPEPVCRLRAANAAGRAGLFAAVRRMLCDRFLRKAPRVERSAALSYFLMSRTILPQVRQR